MKINNKSVRIPVVNQLGLNMLEEKELWMNDLLHKLGQQENHLYDVGVNLGQTLLKWKTHFPQGSYTGFEPNTNCVDYVNELIKQNEFEGCQIHPFGISNESGAGKLHSLAGDKGDSTASMVADYRSDDREAIAVELKSFKDLQLSPKGIVKIDVEGGELEVLNALLEVSSECIIICEILPVYNEENEMRIDRQNKILKLLDEHNYQLYRISKESKIGLSPLETIEIHSDLDWCDYLMIPSNRKNEIEALF